MSSLVSDVTKAATTAATAATDATTSAATTAAKDTTGMAQNISKELETLLSSWCLGRLNWIIIADRHRLDWRDAASTSRLLLRHPYQGDQGKGLHCHEKCGSKQDEAFQCP